MASHSSGSTWAVHYEDSTRYGVGNYCLRSLIVVSFLLIVTATPQDSPQNEKTSHWSVDVPAFYHRLYFSGGESEVRAHLHEVTVLENALQFRGTVSRRLSDGNQLLSLFYLDGKLESCRVESDPVEVAEFYRAIMDDFNCAEHKTARQVFDGLEKVDQATQIMTSSSVFEDDDLLNLDKRYLNSHERKSQSSNLKYTVKDIPDTPKNVERRTEILFSVENSNAEDSSRGIEDSPLYGSEEPLWCSIEDRLERQIWNETFMLLDQAAQKKQLMKEVNEVLHFKSHRKACWSLQRRIRRTAAAQNKPQQLSELHGMKGLQSDDDEVINAEESLLDVQQGNNGNVLHKRRKRVRRSLFSSIMPGTKWCGSGNRAAAPNELGASARTDHCCRQHDQCPYTLVAFERRWGLRNKSLFTMSHCKCDERFRSCLKMTRTSQSRFVGRLFFDLLSKQCFVFRRVRRCARLSWDGSRCIRKRWAKKAIVRDGMNFY
ncbi:uncharacterized protein LOC111265643 isoform X1 [Varroa jacobsoni]|uniref:uncharacterized protein LOC111265643 isoform X1 n=1 Tax=Varroa jacobsoni TaxID=62625 RepID=UPI000BF86F4D|nr:uncharacterized protein LOC111265643 isoform X1 [Varroa jacobsoni]